MSVTNAFVENDVLRWEDGANKIVYISPIWHRAMFHVPWYGAPHLVEVDENNTLCLSDKHLDTAGTSKPGCRVRYSPELKKWYMDIFEGRVKAKAFSWHCDVGDTRNNSDHDSLAADTGSQTVTSTAVDITKGAIMSSKESLETTDTARHQAAADIKITDDITPAYVQSADMDDASDHVSSVASEDQTHCTTLLNDNEAQHGSLTDKDIKEGSVDNGLDSTSSASMIEAVTYAHAGVVSTPGDIAVVCTRFDTDITKDVFYKVAEVQSFSGDESKITFVCKDQDDNASFGEHVLSLKSDTAIAHSDTAKASADTSLNVAVDADPNDSTKADGLVANAHLSDNESSASLQSTALSADIVGIAVVLISPSVEENVTTAKSEATCATLRPGGDALLTVPGTTAVRPGYGALLPIHESRTVRPLDDALLAIGITPCDRPSLIPTQVSVTWLLW